MIWRGDSVIDNVKETLAKLREAGKKCFFVTNNSTKSRAGYKKKFEGLGLDVTAEEIFSSSFAVAAHLDQSKFLEKKAGKKVYVLGEVGICDEVRLGVAKKRRACLLTVLKIVPRSDNTLRLGLSLLLRHFP